MLALQLTSPRDSRIQSVDDVLSWSPVFGFSTRQNHVFSPFRLKACRCQSVKNKTCPAYILLNFHGKPQAATEMFSNVFQLIFTFDLNM